MAGWIAFLVLAIAVVCAYPIVFRVAMKGGYREGLAAGRADKTWRESLQPPPLEKVPAATIDAAVLAGLPTKEQQSQMRFGDALDLLKTGGRVARRGWNGRNMWLALQVPDTHSKMSLPYIYMRTAQGKLVPWLASQSDLLEEDWVRVYPGAEPVRKPADD